MNPTKPQHTPELFGYTPGPWVICEEQPNAILEGDQTGRLIAETFCGDLVSDARLIAAAPSLADALAARCREITNLIKQCDALTEALQAIVALQPECMTREAQDQFDHYTAANGHRVHLCRLLLKAREAAKAALAAAGMTGGGK